MISWVVAASMLAIGLGIGWLMALSVNPVVGIVITSVTGSAAAVIAALGAVNRSGDSETKSSVSVNPLPLAIFIAGIVAGSIIGLYVRTNNGFGATAVDDIEYWANSGISERETLLRMMQQQYPFDPQVHLLHILMRPESSEPDEQAIQSLDAQLSLWSNAGVERTIVAQRFFDILYPASDVSTLSGVNRNPDNEPPGPGYWVLFNATPNDCNSWKSAAVTPEALANRMRLKKDPNLDVVADRLEQYIEDGGDPEEAKRGVLIVLCDR